MLSFFQHISIYYNTYIYNAVKHMCICVEVMELGLVHPLPLLEARLAMRDSFIYMYFIYLKYIYIDNVGCVFSLQALSQWQLSLHVYMSIIGWLFRCDADNSSYSSSSFFFILL
jgi:hypothetical protein